jgi:hypothetical protein
MEQIRENYTFHRTLTEEDLDDKGGVTKTTTQEREIFFVNGHRIGRLVKKDGAILQGKEEKNEQARVKKLVETSMKAPPARRGTPGGMIGQILPMARVSNPRRITFHGRSTLAYDFTGDRDAKGKSTNENAAKKMAGTLYFDEADHQVARMQARFDDNFHVGGGIFASVQKGSTMEVEQALIGDGLWMQTSSAEHLDARVVVKKFREDINIKDFEFKKFNTGVIQQPGPPSK